ncbi:hypothetical protein ACFL4W_04960, partial [Planctomycetota bacterium]
CLIESFRTVPQAGKLNPIVIKANTIAVALDLMRNRLVMQSSRRFCNTVDSESFRLRTGDASPGQQPKHHFNYIAIPGLNKPNFLTIGVVSA